MATLTLSITVPDDQVTRIKNSFCAYHGWTETIPDPNNPGETIPNPVTQNAFIKKRIALFIKDSIRTYESEQATLAAVGDVNTLIIE